MKRKIITTLMGVFITVVCLAQNDSLLISKKGKPILPQKGDFAIGLSANPFFNYLGNAFKNSGQNDFRVGLLNNNLIFGKYFLSPKSAIRLKLALGSNSITRSNSVTNDANPAGKVDDKMKSSNTEIGIMPGFEKRTGNSRFQVSYGGELVLNIANTSDVYTYGNAFSSSNPSPTTTIDFYQKNVTEVISRKAEYRSSSLSYGVRGFIGLEYFIFPKFSVGTEIGLQYLHGKIGKIKDKQEYWDFTGGSLASLSNNSDGTTVNNINTDILNGQIFLMFHF